MSVPIHKRRLPAGVEVQSHHSVHARVWAPACRMIEVVKDGACDGTPLEREADGYFGGDVEGLAAGDRYWFRLDGRTLRPDPASRYQPEGPHGPSQVVDFFGRDGDRLLLVNLGRDRDLSRPPNRCWLHPRRRAGRSPGAASPCSTAATAPRTSRPTRCGTSRGKRRSCCAPPAWTTE